MANVKKKNVNFVYDRKNNKVVVRKNNTNQKKKLVVDKEKEVNEKTIVTQKEKNKKKYQTRQQKYYVNKKSKTTNVKKVLPIDSEISYQDKKISNGRKKTNDIKVIDEYKTIEKKKKYKNNKKSNGNKKRLVYEDDIKNKEEEKKEVTDKPKKNKLKKLLDKIKSKKDGDAIPLKDTKEDKKIRVKRYLKESLVYAIIITIVNITLVHVFDYVNLLNLFDVKWLNYVVTILFSLLISYVFSFFIDCLVTEVWVTIKRHRKEGARNGDNRNIKEENRENIAIQK